MASIGTATDAIPRPAGTRRKSARARLRRALGRALPLSVLTLAVLTAGLAVRIDDTSVVRGLRNLVFDEYLRFNPRPFDADNPVRVLAIDEESLKRIGQWPWPRDKIAEIVERLTAMGAAAVGFDMIFAEPDRLSAESIARMLPEGDAREAVLKEIEGAPRNDIVFASALLSSPAVLGMVADQSATNEDGEEASDADIQFARSKAGFAFAGDSPSGSVPRFPGVTAPLPVLSQASAGLGALNWIPDRDQVVRTVPLVFEVAEGVFVPSLAAETLRVAQGASSFVVRSSNASGTTAFGASSGVNAVRIGNFTVPTNPAGAIRLHFTKTTKERHIPAWQVTEGVVDPGEIAGRIILVGATATGLFDLQATPLESAVPGVDVHAQIIEHIVAGAHLVRPDWAVGLEVVIFVVLTLAFGVSAALTSPFKSIIFGVVMLSIVCVGSYLLFLREGLLVDPSFPVLTSALALLATTAWGAIHERSERQWVRRAFSTYVAKELVEDLAGDRDRLSLGGELKEMTILFADMRNFTTISEGMDAEALTRFINAFLTPLTEVILERRGTIDKYMGDAIMAFWNAPLDDEEHAVHGCEAALEMLRAVSAFNAEHEGVYPQVAIGIGINTGECCVGNLGSDQRFDYSVIGDEVNVASRIEGQTKTYGMSILLGPNTAAAARSAGYTCLSVDEVRVKGKTEAVEVFALLAGPNHDIDPRIAGVLVNLETAIMAYRRDEQMLAATKFAEVARADVAPLRTLLGLYERRVKRTLD